MSSEIRVVAVVHGKPGTADAIERALLRCVAPSRAETGCLLYTLHRDLDRAERFRLLRALDKPRSALRA